MEIRTLQVIQPDLTFGLLALGFFASSCEGTLPGGLVGFLGLGTEF